MNGVRPQLYSDRTRQQRGTVAAARRPLSQLDESYHGAAEPPSRKKRKTTLEEEFGDCRISDDNGLVDERSPMMATNIDESPICED